MLTQPQGGGPRRAPRPRGRGGRAGCPPPSGDIKTRGRSPPASFGSAGSMTAIGAQVRGRPPAPAAGTGQSIAPAAGLSLRLVPLRGRARPDPPRSRGAHRQDRSRRPPRTGSGSAGAGAGALPSPPPAGGGVLQPLSPPQGWRGLREGLGLAFNSILSPLGRVSVRRGLQPETTPTHTHTPRGAGEAEPCRFRGEEPGPERCCRRQEEESPAGCRAAGGQCWSNWVPPRPASAASPVPAVGLRPSSQGPVASLQPCQSRRPPHGGPRGRDLAQPRAFAIPNPGLDVGALFVEPGELHPPFLSPGYSP